jgi:flagellar biosynthesis protein FlhG
MDQAGTLRSIAGKEGRSGRSGNGDGDMKGKRLKKQEKPQIQVIAVTSGKGGVGKTNVVANLGYALTKLNKRVLILDADIGLANIDVLLGLSPKYNLQHVLNGEKSIGEIIVPGPGGMKILPASSGIQELSDLNKEQKLCLLSALNSLHDETDVMLIDTSAGISSNVMYFNLAAQEILVVVSPEPTSITDAYAMMKVLSLKYSENHFRLLVNSVKSAGEAKEVFNNLSLVGQKFLNLSIDYWGYIMQDEYMLKAVRQQRALIELYPHSPASRCFSALAKKVCEDRPTTSSRGNISFFWNQIIDGSEALPLEVSKNHAE